MSERMTFTEKLATYRDRLLGRGALNSLNYESPLVDEELKISYKYGVNDPITGEVLNVDYDDIGSSWSYIEPSQLQHYLDNVWVFRGHRDDSRCEMRKAYPTPIVVDEHGIDTCYDPSDKQLEELADKTGEDVNTLTTLARNYSFRLFQDGNRAISDPEFADEREISKMLEKEYRELDINRRSRYGSAGVLVNMLNAHYTPSEDAPGVGLYDKDEYSKQQKLINSRMYSFDEEQE